MQTIKYGKSALFLVFMMVQSSFAVTYTVKKVGGNFSTIQAAVNQAREGDEIVIMDTEVYAEQVTIDSTKTGLILRSENPRASKKPTIKFKDTINVGPRDDKEALVDSLINFDQNGALQVLRARNVRIEGIGIDGGGVFPFGADGVWESRYALQHGNAALTLFVAGDCIVRDCNITNAYIGINIKDRNEGGVFANPNPADINKKNIIPFSAFAQTGNHLIEYNRIHDNSLGFFFESTWDLGSTVRYNLIYENHHPTKAIADKVNKLTSEGGNQAGGAFMFKDQLLSPLAIYNNTLWHNSILFLGNWKSGGQHLIFNNIFAEPNDYWEGSTTTFSVSFDMSKAFVNRMHNSVYAAQAQLEPNNVRITNDLSVTAPATEGALIKPFPAAAEVRWVETKFLSTDTTSADFLTPDWSDAEVIDYIVDKGWEAAGVKDFDGTRADLGAIPMGGGRPVDIVTIRPTVPIEIAASTATIGFKVEPREGTMTDLKVVMFGIVTRLDSSDVFGAEYTPITTANIQKVSLGTQSVVLGPNTIKVQIPATGDFAFLEMIIEGTGSNGKKFTSAVGFLPYRKLDYTMKVTVLDKVGGSQLTEVNAGQQVILKVETFYMGKPFTNKVDPTDISLQTAGAFLIADTVTGARVESMPGGIDGGSATTPVVFTKVPFGGEEFVSVAGKWIDGAKVVAFLGVSDGILVHAGPPDSVAIQRPSPLGGEINPGEPYTVTTQAFDHWGNVIDKPTGITCISTDTLMGVIGEKDPVLTNANGIADFHAYVKNGDKGDTIPLLATLVVKPTATARAFLIVGEARDKLFILYGDTLSYDITKTIEGCSGDRVPVTIRASVDGNIVEPSRNTPINLNVGSGLKAYATATSTDPIIATQLVSGQVVIYIQAITKNVNDGSIGAISSDPSIKGADRRGINFVECFTRVDHGAFFATNGRGSVDKADIFYKLPLEETEIPDSILLCWPNSSTDCRWVFKSSGDIVLDPVNPAHLIITIKTPFAEATTKVNGVNTDLATTYWVNPATPDAASINQGVTMEDSIGPLLMTATVIERLQTGDDTLIVTFSEPVEYDKLVGKTLILINKAGQQDTLTIKNSKPGSNQAVIVTVDNSLGTSDVVAGDSLMIVSASTVSDKNGNKAHPQNRPVVVQLSAVAPTLVSAYYRDGNGDGIVDTVRATFSKSVVLNGAMGLKIKFVQKESGNVDPDKMVYIDGSGNTIIDIPMDKLFSILDLQDKTSGSMSVEALFAEFEGNNKSTAVADDRAAPVVVAVEYHFGKIGENSSEADWDTLYVKYSEPLKSVPSVALPLNFVNASGGPYEIPVFKPTDANPPAYVTTGEMVGYYRFIVSKKDLTVEGGTKGPNFTVINAKDSAWINTAIPDNEVNVVDASTAENKQTVPNNKRVAVVIKKPPFSLDVQYGPNPFMPQQSLQLQPGEVPAPGTAGIFSVVVKAKTKAAEKTVFEYNFSIYDKVGNLIHRIPETGTTKTEEKILISWDGTNTTNRMVGNGTYIGKLSIDYYPQSSPQLRQPHYFQTIKIGVKRISP